MSKTVGSLCNKRWTLFCLLSHLGSQTQYYQSNTVLKRCVCVCVHVYIGHMGLGYIQYNGSTVLGSKVVLCQYCVSIAVLW